MGNKKWLKFNVSKETAEKMSTALKENPDKYPYLCENLRIPNININIKGYVYILKNEFMPDIIKIGYTSRNPHTRSDELFTGKSGIPGRFDVIHSWELDDAADKEKELHRKCKNWRVNSNREFFKAECLSTVLAIMDQATEDNPISPNTHWTSELPILIDIVNKASRLPSTPYNPSNNVEINFQKLFIRRAHGEVSGKFREIERYSKGKSSRDLPVNFKENLELLTATVKCYTFLRTCIEAASIDSRDTLGDSFKFSMPLPILISLGLGVIYLNQIYEDNRRAGTPPGIYKLDKKLRIFNRARDEFIRCLEHYKVAPHSDDFTEVAEAFDNIINNI